MALYESETKKLTTYLKDSEGIFRDYFILNVVEVTLEKVYKQLSHIVTAVSFIKHTESVLIKNYSEYLYN